MGSITLRCKKVFMLKKQLTNLIGLKIFQLKNFNKFDKKINQKLRKYFDIEYLVGTPTKKKRHNKQVKVKSPPPLLGSCKQTPVSPT